METRVVALDADFVNALYHASQNGFPNALNAIVGEGRLIALTSTVVEELTLDPENHPKDAAVEVWIDNQKLLDNLKVYDTSGFAPGEDRGEQSILSALPRMYADGAGGGVQVFTNDAAARSLFAGSTVADAYDTQGGILISWLEGALSLKEYYDLSVSAWGYAGPPRFKPFPGETLNSSDGHRLTILPTGDVMAQDASGRTYVIGHNEKFRFNADGSITRPDGTAIVENGCFLAGTMIDMWDGTEKPIEDVRPDDWVTSYDRDGHLVPGRVSRVFRHQARHILDVFGLKVTPGHVTLCGDGPFDGQHVPIIDILRSDGALVRKDGTKVRASTGVPLGDMRDRLIWAVTGDTVPDGGIRVRDKGRIRLGTRFITDDGQDICVADLIFGRGATVTEDGLIQTGTGGTKMPYHWPFTAMLPNPEDYVLRRSAVSLTEIYRAAQWESVPPRLPPPAEDTPGPVPLGAAPPQAVAPSGEPPPVRPQRDEPALNRKQRRAIAARQRRTPKPLPGTATVH